MVSPVNRRRKARNQKLPTMNVALLEARRAAGLSQYQLAEKSGVPRSTIARLERPEAEEPQPWTFRRLAMAVGMDVELAKELLWRHGAAA